MQQLHQFGRLPVAAQQARQQGRTRRLARCSDGIGGLAMCLRRGRPGRADGYLLDRCHEAITAQRHIGDEAPAIAAVLQHLAQAGDVHAHAAFLNDGVRPGRGQQLTGRYDFTGAFTQCHQQIEGAASQAQHLAILQQSALTRMDLEAVEPPAAGCRLGAGGGTGGWRAHARVRFCAARLAACRRGLRQGMHLVRAPFDWMVAVEIRMRAIHCRLPSKEWQVSSRQVGRI